MQARLVYHTGLFKVIVPPEMDTPRPDQMQGTVAEQLIELCGRICYDSLGTKTSRPSAEYHRNLLEQRHYAVHESVHFVAGTNYEPTLFIGTPDVYYVQGGRYYDHGMIVNVRHALEAPKCFRGYGGPEARSEWQSAIRSRLQQIAPTIAAIVEGRELPVGGVSNEPFGVFNLDDPRANFVSMFLEDSRVWSHEMVRHRGNISQRSGRFVDETDREMCLHPLLRDALSAEFPFSESEMSTVSAEHPRRAVADANRVALQSYLIIVEYLQRYAERAGLNKRDARKQARSAARYYLGNGLSTEMIFTASVEHWKEIFALRCSPHADAAIRELMESARKIITTETPFGHMV